MPRRACLVCGRLTSEGSHCSQHRPIRGSKAWRTGSSRAWRALRAKALLRDGHRCVRCGATERLAAHHVVPVAEGGTSTLDNLAIMCEDCHQSAHRPAAA